MIIQIDVENMLITDNGVAESERERVDGRVKEIKFSSHGRGKYFSVLSAFNNDRCYLYLFPVSWCILVTVTVIRPR